MGTLDLEGMKIRAYEKLYEEIISQEQLCEVQENDIVMAILGNKEDVWIEKSNGSKVKFSINQATQGLTTILSNILVKKRIFKKLSGYTFNQYNEILQKKGM